VKKTGITDADAIVPLGRRMRRVIGLLRAAGFLVERTASLSRYLGFACLAAMAGLMTIGTILRYIFNSPLVFTEEIVMTLMVPLACLSFAYVFQIGGHIKVDLVTRKLSPRAQEWLARWRELLTILVLVAMIPAFCDQVNIAMTVDRRFETIPSWPLWPVRLIAVIGLCFTAIYLTKVFIEGLWRLTRRDSEPH